MPRAGKAFNLYLSDDERSGLEALAGQIGRSLHDEIRHAISRHLAAPPALVTPPLAPGPVEATARPAGRGRPRKAP